MTPRFTLRQQLGYALWFSRRDLFDPVAAWVSWAVVLAVAVATSAAVVALAVPGVTAEIRLRRLAANPWGRCVWVDAHSLSRLSDAKLREMEAGTCNRATAAPGTATAAGFHSLKLQMFPLGPGGARQRSGRTSHPDDPAFAVLKQLLRSGKGFDGPTGGGVILSPTLLQRLGGSLDNPPPSVRILTPKYEDEREWPVVGVTRDPLPLGYDFLVTESEEQRLRAGDEFIEQSVVFSGSLGDAWPQEWRDFPPDARNAAAKMGFEVTVVERAAGDVLRLEARHTLRVVEWQKHLTDLAGHIAAKHPPAPGFATVSPSQATAPPAPEPLGSYPRATLYVDDLKHIRPAAQAARDMDLHANDAARDMVDEIETTAARAQALVLALVTAFCAAEFGTLTLALYLRGRQKAPQVGMLRAMGAPRRALWLIAGAEAGVLWLAGTVFGLLLAVAVGLALCDAHSVTSDELRAAVRAGWAGRAGLFIGASLLACVLGNWVATWGVRRRPPAEALTLSN